MPLDSFLEGTLGRFTWQRKFVILPKQCYFTKEKFSLTMAYRGTAVWMGPGTGFSEEHIWTTKENYMMLKLKGTI